MKKKKKAIRKCYLGLDRFLTHLETIITVLFLLVFWFLMIFESITHTHTHTHIYIDANLVITWSCNPHAKTPIPGKPSKSGLIGV
jgi:hypothetical protein